ncbi:aminoglycoside phosphotransferase family protein [Paenibacillus mendelii]|uniref:Phosphotransferase n=1 Tax=Paenibacillus mendelii TaxID=206163 RepID=A0ABV6J906_9BACL|nr:aminoglycoside phosphotransferase family protein [Paenibacillus mendelii]MCQ6559701.1 aminoglycoside phosphotransferase family protein [Paenibacillus mendelii]
MSRLKEINPRLIRRKWRKMQFADAFKPILNGTVTLNHRNMKCLKDSYKSSIWKLEIKSGHTSMPVILKISKQLRKPRPESTVEKNIYRRARKVLQPFMPRIYLTKRNINGRDLWVFMEYVEPVKGQVEYNPDHFDRIIPTLARLHAATMNEKFLRHKEMFAGWLPRFDSEEMLAERVRLNKATLQHLDEAMHIPKLKAIVQPYYSLLRNILNKGPGYFPEVSQAGLSIVHGDLHTANMACDNVKELVWDVKFIDWEGAKFAPCWFDLVNLIGVFLAYRREWKDEEEEITKRCVQLYADEMRKNGVVFKTDPMKLYQMAYLKRVLERGLYLQLNWAVTGKKEAKLLRVYLEKIRVLEKKIGLH